MCVDEFRTLRQCLNLEKGPFLLTRIFRKQGTRPRVGHFSIYNKVARTLNLINLQFSSLFRTSPYHLIRSTFCQQGKITGGKLNGCPNVSQCEFSPTSTSTAKERNIPTSGTPSNSQINNRQTKERLGEAVTKLNSNVQSKESELRSKSQQLQNKKQLYPTKRGPAEAVYKQSPGGKCNG